ncbi:hypothetical protein F9231_14125 [Bacillus safensis]|uniref:Uncharacterized protein n=1 Tax=Bacillus safensis TaxID=561879 RepID=A0A5C0WED3_BACIA|nr:MULTISPECIES: hypothetical protein [Bacillus]AYJ91050.1 hypothetical protein CS953_15385 [Bacillus safensis]KAB3538127.1 hypothetical protein F9229_12380 [Bacillus safensis]KAB3543884.1 hypothetical protein F9231_14125 [Bacillus safensis]KIZ54506.1 hypothetical protein UM92_08980 [Bacillus safensis]MCP9285740.1 hypothetical protein [Bacillus safensis]
MKLKIMIMALVSVLVLSVAPNASAYENVKEPERVYKVKIDDQTSLDAEQQKMIDAVKPYVSVSKDGLLSLNNVPKALYEKYSLDQLEGHFAQLNNDVKNGKIIVEKDLSITPTTLSTSVNYARWTYNWWGYDRKFNNKASKSYQDWLYTAVNTGVIVGGLTYWVPPVASIAGVSAGYWGLLATRIGAKNKGKGVYVGVTWVAAFRVDTLK